MAILNRSNVKPQRDPAVVANSRPPIDAEAETVLETPEAEVESSVLEAANPIVVERDQEPSRSVAEYHANDLTSPARQQGSVAVMAEAMADAGIAGVGISSRTFPIVALKDGQFEDSDNRVWGKEIKGRVLGANYKFVLTAKKDLGNGKTDDETLFSPDKQFSASGVPVQEIFDRWEEEGRDFSETDWKEYRDIVLLIEEHDNPELEGEIVVLSVSPQSVPKWNGSLIKMMVRNGIRVSDLSRLTSAQVAAALDKNLLVATIGAKVTGVQYPYYPWAFAFVKDPKAQG